MRVKRTGRHWLYFLYDNDTVVYIGVTKNLRKRISQHKGKKFNSVRVERYSTKMEAMHHERRNLVEYMPKYCWIPPFLKAGKKFGKLVVSLKEKELI